MKAGLVAAGRSLFLDLVGRKHEAGRNRDRPARGAGRGSARAPMGSGDVQRALHLAARRREAGRLDAAVKLYRRVLASEPETAEALHWLGVIEHQRGRDEPALELLERAARLRPGDAQCLYHLGELQRGFGRHAEAVESYRRALARESNVADIHFGLGTSLLELGRAEEAAHALRRALALSPSDPEILNNLGNAVADLGQTHDAITHYRHALRLRPDFAEAHMNLGSALAEGGDIAAAEASHRAAVAADARRVDTRRRLARFLEGEERFEEAAEVLEEAVRLAPEDASMRTLLGRCLFKAGRVEAARRCHEQALELAPELADAHFNLGVCLQSEGRFVEAARAHRKALGLRPTLTEAYFHLGLMASENPSERELAELETIANDPSLSDEARISVGFALAKALERRGDIDRAFACYHVANALRACALAFDASEHIAFVDRLIDTFDEAFFAARRGWGVPSGRPLLIVGMPRSGTSLVEQILASHPAVHGAGELNELRRMVQTLPQRLGGAARFPDCARDLDARLAAKLGAEYLQSLERHSPDASRVTDKMPSNYLRLGLAALLLPQARVIHCRRSALDTCLSCYCNRFAHGLSFTYDLEHLGLVYREYERLMAHWTRVLPLQVLEVDYEELVQDQEAVSRRLVEFCGLPWDERCLAFHATPRAVRTASFWQVRQPLYSTSIGRWRAFAHHLEPLIAALGPAADTHAQ